LALYLAAAGVGTLGIVDDDVVSLANLQRQILHGDRDVGRPKTQSAADAIARLTPDTKIEPHQIRLNADNAANIIEKYDLVADGSDNFATRFVVNDACYAAGRTLVSGAVIRFDGQLSTYKAHERPDGVPRNPCYRCLVPSAPEGDEGDTCSGIGVLGAAAGVMGSLQAVEVVKEILSIGDSMAGRLLIWDFLSGIQRTVRVHPDPDCPLCGKSATAPGVSESAP
jgi:molybdopterin/thiamine biosynthesis adenylyltransferase